MLPAAVDTWNSIKADGGYRSVRAFKKVWYDRGDLTPEEEVELTKLFEKYPLGRSNFKQWLKQTVRQLFEKAVEEERKASSPAIAG